MASATYHTGFFNTPTECDPEWRIESMDTYAKGAFLLSGCGGFRMYLYPEHLRMLRHCITEALGEQPQEDSSIEDLRSRLSDAQNVIDDCVKLLNSRNCAVGV